MFDFTLAQVTSGEYNVTLFATERGATIQRDGLTFLTWVNQYGGVGEASSHNGENGENQITFAANDEMRFAYDNVSSTAYLYNVTKNELAVRNLSSDNEKNHLVSVSSADNTGASAVFTNSGKDYASYGTVYDMSSLAGDTQAFTTYVKTMLLVPEPTTATLSMLALAGLAARRRRK